MKTARFLLACALVSALAACGSQGITAPDAVAPARPHFDEDPIVGGEPTHTQDTGGQSNCVLVVIVNPDGSLSTVCQTSSTNRQLGSGG